MRLALIALISAHPRCDVHVIWKAVEERFEFRRLRFIVVHILPCYYYVQAVFCPIGGSVLQKHEQTLMFRKLNFQFVPLPERQR